MSWEKRFTAFIGSKASVILHTIFFAVMFILPVFGIEFNTVLLALTTLVSLEAIYLAIFIQMSVNESSQNLEEVGQDIDEIQKDVDEIQQDVDEIQHDVDEIESDIDEIQEDVSQDKEVDSLESIHEKLQILIQEVNRLKNKKDQ